MKRLAVYSRMFTALCCVAVPAALADDRADGVRAGRALAEAKCARCHAIDREDASKHERAPPFRDVIRRYPAENLAEALAEGIVSGHPDMPVFVFEAQEIDAFLAYLDSLGPAESE